MFLHSSAWVRRPLLQAAASRPDWGRMHSDSAPPHTPLGSVWLSYAGLNVRFGVSVPTPTVPNVVSDDVVDPGDAAIQSLLALTAENSDDDEKREKLLDTILTLPPLTEWAPESREKLLETCQFIKGLAHDVRQRGESGDVGGI